jgi:hypothetical protein
VHFAILVIGKDPMALIDAEASRGARLVWGAIGGRFSGRLILKPGATTGRVYSNAASDLEAGVAMTGVKTWSASAPGPGKGVDQARKGDVDWETTDIARYMRTLVIDGVWHEWPNHLSVAAVTALAKQVGQDPLEMLERAKPNRAWQTEELARAAEIDQLLDIVPDDAQCTVVAAHE